ncbi:hypothetical protein ACWGH4_04480 [Streptomyces sp. NPDC054847]
MTMATSTGTKNDSTGSTGLRHTRVPALTAAAPLLPSLTGHDPLVVHTSDGWARGPVGRDGGRAPDRDRIQLAPDPVTLNTVFVTGHHCAFRQQSSACRGALR